MRALRLVAPTLILLLTTGFSVTAQDLLSPRDKIYQCTYLLYLDNEDNPRGSAWIINTKNKKKTIAITAAHCVLGNKKQGWKIRHPAWKPEEHIPMYVVGYNEPRDVAILAYTHAGGYPGLDLSTRTPNYGEMVTCIINGADYPYHSIRTRYYLTTKRTAITGLSKREREYNIFLGQAVPGTSGSPILNRKGDVIGITIALQKFITEEKTYEISLGISARYILYTLRDYGFNI